MHHIAVVGGVEEHMTAFMRAINDAAPTRWFDIQSYVRDCCKGVCTPDEFVATAAAQLGSDAIVNNVIESAEADSALVTGITNGDEVRALMRAGYTLVMLGNIVDFNRDDFDFIVIDPRESTLTDLANHIVGNRPMKIDTRDLMAHYRLSPIRMFPRRRT